MTVDLSEAQVNLIVQMADTTLRATGLQAARDAVALLDHIQAAQNAAEAKTDGG